MKRIAALLALTALVGCKPPGKPGPEDRWKAASAITDFPTLYAQNCRGCHGIEGTPGPSIALDSPTFLAAIPRATLMAVTQNGLPGTLMPAFSQAHGGPLTDAQMEIIANALMAKAPNPPPAGIPPYAGPLGSAAAGQAAFGVFCASCHGADGSGGKAGSVIDPAFLGLASDQYLRTIAIAGRSDLGCPDFASRVPARVMTDADVSDIVAWLASHRTNEFGQRAPVSIR